MVQQNLLWAQLEDGRTLVYRTQRNTKLTDAHKSHSEVKIFAVIN